MVNSARFRFVHVLGRGRKPVEYGVSQGDLGQCQKGL